ncbi:protein FAM210B, mitochondrial isoform X2 [Hyla sarda]|uniref:protein FAM210B, mitochondrial isoform X2 n=2 Tax=Hyla sarda TaxID=327740 RepID=UPI0024C3F863|nr:protein FAM210B, mitochondrial isoform X2 [Hyla sarda]
MLSTIIIMCTGREEGTALYFWAAEIRPGSVLCLPGSGELRSPVVMLRLPGLLLRRGPALGPAFRSLCVGTARLHCVREVGAVRPVPCLLPATTVMSTRTYSSQGTDDPAGRSMDEGQKPSKTQQLKRVFKEYGGVAVAFHVGISLVSLGIFYALVSSGLDVPSLLLKVGFSEAVVQSKLAAGTSTFVLAYAVHKLFAPVRISITVVSVPFLVRYFRRIGFFKPPS